MDVMLGEMVEKCGREKEMDEVDGFGDRDEGVVR